MTSTLFNGTEIKKFYSKHLIYPESNNKYAHHPQIMKQQNSIKTNNDLNKSQSQSQSNSQSNSLNRRKQKELLNSVYLQKSLFTNTRLLNDLNRHTYSSLRRLSPTNNLKIKSSVPHSPVRSIDDILIITLIYKSKPFYFYLSKFEDAMCLAKKIDNELQLNFFNYQLEHLALKLAKEINLIIETIPLGTSRNYKYDSNINGFIIDLEDLIKRSSRIKVCAKFGNKMFNYFITDDDQDINETVDDIISILNNDIDNDEHNEIKRKKTKYDQERLKEHLRITISNSIRKSLTIE